MESENSALLQSLYDSGKLSSDDLAVLAPLAFYEPASFRKILEQRLASLSAEKINPDLISTVPLKANSASSSHATVAPPGSRSSAQLNAINNSLESYESQPQIGTRLGPYELLSELGRGGMGTVYRARHTGLDRDCALKLLRANGSLGPKELDRFISEARTVAALDNHRNIVKVFDAGLVENSAYMAMELVDGTDLKRLIDARKVQQRPAARVVADIAQALEYAHARGIIHRDIKPANILIDRESRARLTDFGIAKVNRDAEQEATMTGTVLGTFPYMAPEQAEDSKQVDERSDVYGLGAVLYECLTGRPPHIGSSPMNVLASLLKSAPPRPSELNPKVDPSLEAICLKALEREPDQRFQSAAELREALDAYRRGEELGELGLSPQQRPATQPAPRLVAAAALLFFLLLGFAFMSTGAPTKKQPSAARWTWLNSALKVELDDNRQLTMQLAVSGPDSFLIARGDGVKLVGPLEAGAAQLGPQTINEDLASRGFTLELAVFSDNEPIPIGQIAVAPWRPRQPAQQSEAVTPAIPLELSLAEELNAKANRLGEKSWLIWTQEPRVQLSGQARGAERLHIFFDRGEAGRQSVPIADERWEVDIDLVDGTRHLTLAIGEDKGEIETIQVLLRQDNDSPKLVAAAGWPSPLGSVITELPEATTSEEQLELVLSFSEPVRLHKWSETLQPADADRRRFSPSHRLSINVKLISEAPQLELLDPAGNHSTLAIPLRFVDPAAEESPEEPPESDLAPEPGEPASPETEPDGAPGIAPGKPNPHAALTDRPPAPKPKGPFRDVYLDFDLLRDTYMVLLVDVEPTVKSLRIGDLSIDRNAKTGLFPLKISNAAARLSLVKVSAMGADGSALAQMEFRFDPRVLRALDAWRYCWSSSATVAERANACLTLGFATQSLRKTRPKVTFLDFRRYRCGGVETWIAAYDVPIGTGEPRKSIGSLRFHLLPGNTVISHWPKDMGWSTSFETSELVEPFLLAQTEVPERLYKPGHDARLPYCQETSPNPQAAEPASTVTWVGVQRWRERQPIKAIRIPSHSEWLLALNANPYELYYPMRRPEIQLHAVDANVKAKRWNAFGLVDLEGNVSEWTISAFPMIATARPGGLRPEWPLAEEPEMRTIVGLRQHQLEDPKVEYPDWRRKALSKINRGHMNDFDLPTDTPWTEIDRNKFPDEVKYSHHQLGFRPALSLPKGWDKGGS